MASANVRIELDNPEQIRVEPTSYLGRELFSKYLAAVRRAGASYDAARRCQVATIGALATLAASLREEGFGMVVADEVREAAAERAGEIRADIAAVQKRGQAIEEKLAERGLRLYPFQRDGVGWLAAQERAGLFDQMGLGKTVQALVAAPAEAPVLAVVPKIALGSWIRHARDWRSDLRVVVLTSTGRFSWSDSIRVEAGFRWPQPGEFLLTNYENLPDEPTGAAVAGTVLIADEAHYTKNPRALRTKRWRALAAAVQAVRGRTWILTGTPLLGKREELWHVLEGVGLAKETFANFRRYYYADDATVADRLRRVSLMRRREEVLPDLPEKSYQDVNVECVDAVSGLRGLCDEVYQAIEAAARERGTSLAEALLTLAGTKDSRVPFELISRVRAQLAVAKTPAAVELVQSFEEASEPLVVFSRHRAPVDAIGARPGWARISGDETATERDETVRAFQAGELRGIAATIQAGGVAVTLTRAARVLFVDLDWTPALNQQAEDRVCRIGQSRGVLVYRLIADHLLDERVVEVLTEKQRLIERRVEASAVAVPGDTLEVAAALEAVAAATPVEPEESAEPAAPTAPRGPARRGPLNGIEVWAARALSILAGNDPDYASTRNNVGFNRFDGDLGHSLAEQIASGRWLTDNQWRAAVKLAMRYPRQVGRPEADGEPQAASA